MKMKHLIPTLLIVFIGCQAEFKQPIIEQTNLDYTYLESKYTLKNDSSIMIKSFQRMYHLEISDSAGIFKANWTDKIPITKEDSTNSKIDKLLNRQEYSDGLTARFKLTKTGNIDSLENWNTVKTYVDSMTSLYYTLNNLTQPEIETLIPITKIILTKERLMNSFLKGIVAFHFLYDIPATFSDTLVYMTNIYHFDQPNDTVKSKIKIQRPNNILVDYLVTTELSDNFDTELFTLLDTISNNEINFNFIKELHLNDTIYYRFNSKSNEIDYFLYKRTLMNDTLQLINEIQIIKE